MSYYRSNNYNNHHSNYNGYYGQPQPQSSNLFPEFDRNRDGMITEQDFALAARQKNLGYDGEMIYRNAFRQVDKNHDGYLNQYETGNNYSVIRDVMF